MIKCRKCLSALSRHHDIPVKKALDMKHNTFLQILIVTLMVFIVGGGVAIAGSYSVNLTDQTPTTPLAKPTPSSYQPRYISGFGSDNSFTVFFEDRDNGGRISYVTTTSGPTGFPANATATNITDTHFCIKNWPITISGTIYAYRAWASVGNNADHHFYVTNDLSNWTLVSTFTISNASTFTNARGSAHYGFHDVVQLNGSYYAFTESNLGQTMIVKSANGDDQWEAIASVGGTSTQAADGPLLTPVLNSAGWTPSGSFVALKNDSGYGKFYISPDNGHLYMAVNSEAKSSLSPAEQEAAFIKPANWTWNDGSTGRAASAIYTKTTEHDIRELWVVPKTDPSTARVIMYDADFGGTDGGKALGYFTITGPNSITVQSIQATRTSTGAYLWILAIFLPLAALLGGRWMLRKWKRFA